jgi:hypothetical protein
MLSVTVALAEPLLPAVTAIQLACDPAVHPHPESVATATDSVPPAAAIESLLRLRE